MVKDLEFEVVIIVAADTLAPHPSGSQRKLRAHDLYTAATRARQKLIITGTQLDSARCGETGLNVLAEAETLSAYLGSAEFEDRRMELDAQNP